MSAAALLLWLPIAVSICALIISTLALWLNWRTQVRQLRFQERADEERAKAGKRAVLSAGIIHGPKQGAYRLAIENTGLGTARDIRITLDGAPFEKHEMAVSGATDLPQVLGSNSQFDLLLAPSFDSEPPFKLILEWSDDTGLPGQFESSLSLP